MIPVIFSAASFCEWLLCGASPHRQPCAIKRQSRLKIRSQKAAVDHKLLCEMKAQKLSLAYRNNESSVTFVHQIEFGRLALLGNPSSTNVSYRL
jgi:hypothetical protein